MVNSIAAIPALVSYGRGMPAVLTCEAELSRACYPGGRPFFEFFFWGGGGGDCSISEEVGQG